MTPKTSLCLMKTNEVELWWEEVWPDAFPRIRAL